MVMETEECNITYYSWENSFRSILAFRRISGRWEKQALRISAEYKQQTHSSMGIEI